jgi:hypothetical protein
VAQEPAAKDICGYWPVIKGALEILKAVPSVPKEVKQAIDLVLKFGDEVCPKIQVVEPKKGTILPQLTALMKNATKPDWQTNIDWSIGNTGPVDCPEQYAATYPECIFKGGRSCLMRKAIDSAKANNDSWAFQLTLITQCHNSAAQTSIANAGQQAVCDYLRTKN